MKIALKLDHLGVDYVEGGWPGSNPKDLEFFKMAKDVEFKNATLAAFGSTRRPGGKVEEDANLNAFIESGAKVITIFGKSWDFHVTEALGVPLEENLAMIRESIVYLKDNGKRVFYDAEHFFDGYKANPEYAIKTLLAAQESGAECIILCDTNGGCLPHEIVSIMDTLKKSISTPLGIHCHNDGDLAVANSLVAVEAGAVQVQGTMNGLGERCGNANLCSVIPNLQLKMGYDCLGDKLSYLTEAARYVSEIANLSMPTGQPFVGHSAFAHKGGIHVSAVMKNPKTYEHLAPEEIGNKRRVLISDQSGASNLRYKVQELGLEFPDDKNLQRNIIKKVKEMEHAGYQFEGAEGSFELLLKKEIGEFEPGFELDSFRVITQKLGNAKVNSEATIKLTVGDQVMHTAAEGNGPVNALDNALRKALRIGYPEIDQMHLADYKVRVLEGKDATGAQVRVLVDSKDENDSWGTIGVSSDIIEASWHALTDSISYKLMKDKKNGNSKK
jgi:2-isopropylmalate synthase